VAPHPGQRPGRQPRLPEPGSVDLSPTARVPDPDRSVAADARDLVSLWAPRDVGYAAGVPGELPDLLPSDRVPEPDGGIVSRAGEQRAVRGPRAGADPAGFATELIDLLSSRWVPEPDRSFDGDGKDGAVGAPRDCPYRAIVPGETADFRSSGGIPQPQG